MYEKIVCLTLITLNDGPSCLIDASVVYRANSDMYSVSLLYYTSTAQRDCACRRCVVDVQTSCDFAKVRKQQSKLCEFTKYTKQCDLVMVPMSCVVFPRDALSS